MNRYNSGDPSPPIAYLAAWAGTWPEYTFVRQKALQDVANPSDVEEDVERQLGAAVADRLVYLWGKSRWLAQLQQAVEEFRRENDGASIALEINHLANLGHRQKLSKNAPDLFEANTTAIFTKPTADDYIWLSLHGTDQTIMPDQAPSKAAVALAKQMRGKDANEALIKQITAKGIELSLASVESQTSLMREDDGRQIELMERFVEMGLRARQKMKRAVEAAEGSS